MKPKVYLLIVQLVLILNSTNAQIPPKDSFQLLLSTDNLLLAKGETDSISISVLRSKFYKKGNAVFRFSSPEVKGISVTIQPINDQPDNYSLVVAINDQAESGDYNLIPSCTLRDKTKGVIVKITVK